MAQPGITVKWLRAPHRGQDEWRSDGGARGSGRLIARRRAGGVFFSFRYSPRTGEEDALPIGEFDEAGRNGMTLVQARAAAGELAKLYRSGTRDLRGHLERERAAAEHERSVAEAAAREAAERAGRGTLRQLLDAYLAHLRSGGKEKSAKDAASQVKCHLAPELLGTKAAEVPVEAFVAVLGRVVAKGHGRTAAKLRSTLRAAYELAIRSRLDPTVPGELAIFSISLNPLASIGSLSKFNRVRNRHLSAEELGAFLRRLAALGEGAQKDVLQLCLLLGGQRPMQLLRVQPGQVDLSAATITLLDTKGKRQQPRVHVVPLVPEATAILKRRLDSLAADEPLFSTDGRRPMRVETLDGVLSGVVDAMLAADPPELRERFQLRDLRRTCETMLAALKVPSDIRAQIQSHGLGGIQARHYDRHSYALEKKQALTKWARHLEKLKAGERAAVIFMDKGKKRDRT